MTWRVSSPSRFRGRLCTYVVADPGTNRSTVASMLRQARAALSGRDIERGIAVSDPAKASDYATRRNRVPLASPNQPTSVGMQATSVATAAAATPKSLGEITQGTLF